MNFSVPDRVKEEFNKYYAGENKSAVLTKLLEEAIEAKKKQEQRAKALEGILEFRKGTKPISTAEILKIKEELRE
jgi:metal-responsive CopG/Arc/MetJ family transcriptional regulator